LAIATNAFRITSNANEIINEVKNKTGINIKIISGNEEAEYSFLGAVSDNADEKNDILVIDIGGGSTELIFGRTGRIKYKNSFHTGVVTGTENYFLHNPPYPSEVNEFTAFLNKTFVGMNFSKPIKTIAIAGTPTTLACIQKGLEDYSEDKVEGSVLKSGDLIKLKEELACLSSEQIENKYKTVVAGREDILLAGTIILYELMELLKIPEIVVSTRGIRYGVIYKKIMNDKISGN
jgi:exopolyphosphatase/guanosine-5'-triphosphate,3'-diphosphate pyrophosphatase